jgi:glycosyltransferase involved in cell wall biosynthesis
VSLAAPRVSVIVPTYQRAAVVLEALESVLAQTLDDLEVLLVDDGSTDGTEEAVRARFGDEPRLRILRQANGGASSARNLGLEHARGAYVSFLDSDDLYDPEYLARQVQRLESKPGAGVVVCDARYEGTWPRAGTTVFGRASFRPPLDLDAILDGAWVLPSCLMFRRAEAPDVRYDETFRVVEDVDFLARLYDHGLVGVLNRRVLTRYRKLGTQATDDELAIQEGMLRVLETYADRSTRPRRHAGQRARRKARILMAQGEWAAARPYLKAWLRARPGIRPLRYLLASYRRSPSR